MSLLFPKIGQYSRHCDSTGAVPASRHGSSSRNLSLYLPTQRSREHDRHIDCRVGLLSPLVLLIARDSRGIHSDKRSGPNKVAVPFFFSIPRYTLAHTRWIGLWSFCRQRPAFFCLARDELNAGPHQNLFAGVP